MIHSPMFQSSPRREVTVPEFAGHLRALKQVWRLLKHLRYGWKQFREGPAIGERATPVFSFWPILRKFERLSWFYETVGQDGDLEIRPKEKEEPIAYLSALRVPPPIRLVYVRFGNWGVLQIAYWLRIGQ